MPKPQFHFHGSAYFGDALEVVISDDSVYFLKSAGIISSFPRKIDVPKGKIQKFLDQLEKLRHSRESVWEDMRTDGWTYSIHINLPGLKKEISGYVEYDREVKNCVDRMMRLVPMKNGEPKSHDRFMIQEHFLKELKSFTCDSCDYSVTMVGQPSENREGLTIPRICPDCRILFDGLDDERMYIEDATIIQCPECKGNNTRIWDYEKGDCPKCGGEMIFTN